ncbi:hypothetical protein C0J52_03268 [Blattella germanica]|nr:hypothetical protein C0J52_03268 [Blattella germanica]
MWSLMPKLKIGINFRTKCNFIGRSTLCAYMCVIYYNVKGVLKVENVSTTSSN